MGLYLCVFDECGNDICGVEVGISTLPHSESRWQYLSMRAALEAKCLRCYSIPIAMGFGR